MAIRARPVPLYEMVDSTLRQRLLDRSYLPGSMIPSEMKLADELGVSQGTVRRALNGLVDEGLLLRRQGLGTFVPEIDDRKALFLFFNLVAHDGTHEMAAADLVSNITAEATQQEIQRLSLSAGSLVRRLLRVRLLRGAPTIVERIVVSEDAMPRLGEDAPLPAHLFRHYENAYGLTVTTAEERLRAAAASAEDADLLRVPPGTPLLEIERVAHSVDGSPIEWRRSMCHTSAHDYLIHRP